MALRKLQLGESLAKKFKGNLIIVSCWDFPFESYLMNNPHLQVDGGKLRTAINTECSTNESTLKNLIKASGIKSKYIIESKKGKAHKCIPRIVKEMDIDILIMGTISRTGISGFVIGNTAENILQNVTCSVLTVKPKSFISPIKID